jgi:hypothetical protein
MPSIVALIFVLCDYLLYYSRMSVEARLDLWHFDLRNHEIGELVGECEGEIMGIGDEDEFLVSVNPSPEVCDRCLLSEYCTESKAD